MVGRKDHVSPSGLTRVCSLNTLQGSSTRFLHSRFDSIHLLFFTEAACGYIHHAYVRLLEGRNGDIPVDYGLDQKSAWYAFFYHCL